MKNFLKHLFDSRRRQVEAHLVLLSLGVVTFVALAICHVVFMHRAFDAGSYGQGLGYLLAGGGAAALGQGLQRKAEGSNESAE